MDARDRGGGGPDDRRAGGRRRLGAGVYLVEGPPEGGHALRVDAGFPIEGWLPRRRPEPGEVGRMLHPGTAVLHEGGWYEVVDVDDEPRGPRLLAYYLDPWDDRFVMRSTSELTPELCRRAAALYRGRRTQRRRARWLRLVPFLVGLLPAEEQRRVESTYGVSAAGATALSALILLGLSSTVLIGAYAASRGLEMGAAAIWIEPFVPLYRRALAVYLMFESLHRLMSGWSGGEPLGSLPVVILWRLGRMLGRLRS